jgi:hypothetical protein
MTGHTTSYWNNGNIYIYICHTHTHRGSNSKHKRRGRINPCGAIGCLLPTFLQFSIIDIILLSFPCSQMQIKMSGNSYSFAFCCKNVCPHSHRNSLMFAEQSFCSLVLIIAWASCKTLIWCCIWHSTWNSVLIPSQPYLSLTTFRPACWRRGTRQKKT